MLCAVCDPEYAFATCLELLGNIFVAVLVGNVLRILANLNLEVCRTYSATCTPLKQKSAWRPCELCLQADGCTVTLA